jgi:hypothetical protein
MERRAAGCPLHGHDRTDWPKVSQAAMLPLCSPVRNQCARCLELP